MKVWKIWKECPDCHKAVMQFDKAWTEAKTLVVIPMVCPVCEYTEVLHIEVAAPAVDPRMREA